MAAQRERLTHLGACGFQQMRVQLLFQKLVGQTLVHQNAAGIRGAGLRGHQRAGIVRSPQAFVLTEVTGKRFFAPRALRWRANGCKCRQSFKHSRVALRQGKRTVPAHGMPGDAAPTVAGEVVLNQRDQLLRHVVFHAEMRRPRRLRGVEVETGALPQVLARLRADINEAVWRGGVVQTSVGVKMIAPEVFDREPIYELDGLSLDRLDLECTQYQPAPELLSAAMDEQPVSEVLVSNLLKSNCLVTGQPDWGTVQISYSGPQIDQEGLLKYIVSFRNHNEFHEQCVERIFMDIWNRCKPIKLTVYARYTRRGGLDINPFRTSHPQALPVNSRNARQ